MARHLLALWILSLFPAPLHAAPAPRTPLDETFPPIASDYTFYSLGRFQVMVHPTWRALLSNYPLVDPLALDSGDPDEPFPLELSDFLAYTQLGSSGALEDGSLADVGGVPVGTYGQTVGERDFQHFPPGFRGPLDAPEVHLELQSMDFYGLEGGNVSIRVGTVAGLTLSPGELQASGGADGPDLPARGFFQLFPALTLPPSTDFPGARFETLKPLQVTAGEISSFPPRAVFQMEGPAIPLFFAQGFSRQEVIEDENGQQTTLPPETLWAAGDLFGWIVSAGVALGYENNDVDRAAFEASMGPVPPAQTCADGTGDEQVDGLDLAQVASGWGARASGLEETGLEDSFDAALDLDQDGVISVMDVMRVAVTWGEPCAAALPAAPSSASLRLNEVLPRTASRQGFVELLNPTAVSVEGAGLVLEDGNGIRFSLPSNLPPVPPGAFVVVAWGGNGEASDLDFSDGIATVQVPSGQINPFEPTGDQVTLYRPGGSGPRDVLDFVAWGIPALEDEDAVVAGLWAAGTAISMEPGGFTTGEGLVDTSIGVAPGRLGGGFESWVLYMPEASSMGSENGVAAIGVMMPPDGTLQLSDTFSLAWYEVPDALQYRLQLSSTIGFEAPSIDVMLEGAGYVPQTPPPDGLWYWRVQVLDVDGNSGPFSAPVSTTVVTLEPSDVSLGTSRQAHLPSGRTSPSASAWVGTDLRIPAILQKKDTRMLCLDGDDETGTRKPWDGPHTDRGGNAVNHSAHGRNYCARASMAMINHFYGGDLSQDRISFEQFGRVGGPTGKHDGAPVGDLGHDVPLKIVDAKKLMEWALSGSAVTYVNRKPAFADIRAWIDGGRLPMVAIPGHALVLSGWEVYQGMDPAFVGQEFVYVTDPWDQRKKRWNYATTRIFQAWVPDAASGGKMQEADFTLDTDADNILDFDESTRFNTLPAQADTDGDLVRDKNDIRAFAFLEHNKPTPMGAVTATSDNDLDGLTMPNDVDSDNGTKEDGVEDTNQNGHLDSGRCETSNFFAADDKAKKVKAIARQILAEEYGSAISEGESCPYTVACSAVLYRRYYGTEIFYTDCSCNPSNACRPWLCTQTGCFEFS